MRILILLASLSVIGLSGCQLTIRDDGPGKHAGGPGNSENAPGHNKNK